ncbi:MAG: hypothetical protein HS111_23465 [Kofleriaceae bacterium]|nr:hypothetical protein [Kofleriaceae bacterium]
MGLTAVCKGGVLELVETAQAKDAALAAGSQELPRRRRAAGAAPGQAAPRAGRGIARRARAGALAPRLGRALPGLRALLVTDDGRHVAAMRTLVAELDRALDGASLWTIPVEHRPARAALVELLVPLVTEPAAPRHGRRRGRAAPGADPRINVVFVVGSAAAITRGWRRWSASSTAIRATTPA